MMSSTPLNLIDRLWPATVNKSQFRTVILLLAGVALLTLSAKISVPFWPVPLTMQTFMVLMIGMTYERRLGLATVGLYLVSGALGAPVFSGGAGYDYLLGPTGGYLIGFFVATYPLSLLQASGWDRSYPRALAAMTLGSAVIMGLGFLWLSTLIGAGDAFQKGVLPFLPGEGLKVLIAAGLLPSIWRLAGKSH